MNYVGSITVDEGLMNAVGSIEYEKVQVVDIDNGARFETYVIADERNSGCSCLNGATARCVHVGDKVIMAYAQMLTNEIENHRPKIVFVNERNEIIEIADCGTHEEIK